MEMLNKWMFIMSSRLDCQLSDALIKLYVKMTFFCSLLDIQKIHKRKGKQVIGYLNMQG